MGHSEEEMLGRAPPFDPFRRHFRRLQLKSGGPAAHESYHLPLLSSEPDGVRRLSPRRTRLSTPIQIARGNFSHTYDRNSASL